MGKTKIEIIEELKKFKKENNIMKIIFFGSRAKKEGSEYSDIDLVLVSPRSKGIKSFKRSPPPRTRWKLDSPVDMLCYTPEEFNRRKDKPTIVRKAVRTGIET